MIEPNSNNTYCKIYNNFFFNFKFSKKIKLSYLAESELHIFDNMN